MWIIVSFSYEKYFYLPRKECAVQLVINRITEYLIGQWNTTKIMKLNKKPKLCQIESKQNCSILFAKYMQHLKWCCLKCTLIAATAMLTECKQNFNAQKLVTSCPSKILSVTHALSPFYSHSTSNENNSNANAYTQYSHSRNARHCDNVAKQLADGTDRGE